SPTLAHSPPRPGIATAPDTRARWGPSRWARRSGPAARCLLFHHPVRVDDILVPRPGVELLLRLRRLVERDLRGVDRFRDLRLIVHDPVHEQPVVLLH